MSDRTSARLLGKVFEILAENPIYEHKEFAKKLFAKIRDYDFSNYEMDADESLIILGLAKKEIDSECPEDGEVVIYNTNVSSIVSEPHVGRSTYYTPTLDEFHNDFEYEIFEDWGVEPERIWHKQIFGKDGNNPERIGYVYENNLNRMRVKHLDKTDIESLGFSLSQIEGDSHDWEWDITNKDGVGIGVFHDTNDDDIQLLSCTFKIKNKTELKILLRQLKCAYN